MTDQQWNLLLQALSACFSGLSALIATLALFYAGRSIRVAQAALDESRKTFEEAHRPVVTAFLDDQITGNVASAYRLVIANTGNRPALEVRLDASAEDLAGLVNEPTAIQSLPGVASTFSEQALISILRDGEELFTSFGAVKAGQEPSLRYNGRAQITITYQDLRGRRYAEHIPLIVRARKGGFGGGQWGSTSS